jgi:hypothetical protein
MLFLRYRFKFTCPSKNTANIFVPRMCESEQKSLITTKEIAFPKS